MTAPRRTPELTDIRGLIIDLDGVLWVGDTPLPGLHDFFALLHGRDIPYTLASNNATATPQAVHSKLRRMGVDVEPNRIITSSEATAAYLQRRLTPGAGVLVVGEEGLRSALARAGFVLRDRAEGVSAVAVGLDRSATYNSLAEATFALRAGALFVATNPDPTFPTERGLGPGAGALLALLQTACGLSPVIIGKPEPYLFRHALERIGVDAQHALVVGDRLETDILGGQRAGLATALLLTGVTTDLALAESPIRPTWAFAGLPELTQALRDSTR
ncbi:MAG: HAD-IIA family hydrolase [Chloroflexota bacterium]